MEKDPDLVWGGADLLASEGPCSGSWDFGIGRASVEVLAQEGAPTYQELLAKQLQKWPSAFDVPLQFQFITNISGEGASLWLS